MNYAGFHKDQNCNRYPNIFPDVVPQLKFAFHTIQYGNLSVALLHFVCHIVQFSRCIAPASFEARLKHSSFLKCFNPISILVEISGIEPLTSCLQGRRSPSWAKPPLIYLNPFPGFFSWWARVGSNHRPCDYQSHALASWATGPYHPEVCTL